MSANSVGQNVGHLKQNVVKEKSVRLAKKTIGDMNNYFMKRNHEIVKANVSHFLIGFVLL